MKQQKTSSWVIMVTLMLASTVGVAVSSPDIVPVIEKTDLMIRKTYVNEDLTREYYQDKVKKLLSSSTSDDTKIVELNKIIDQLQEAAVRKNKAEVNVVPAKVNIRDSLVIVSGDKGAGSAFVTDFNGKKVVITNIHVLLGNEKVKFIDSYNRQLEVRQMSFAADRDIAVIELTDNCKLPSLPLEKDVSTYLDNEKIIVAGNSQGAGSLRTLTGELKGLGPEMVEVSATFVQGNSGSPIVALRTGKVIGVATSVAKAGENWVNRGSGFEKLRYFGTRIDNLEPATLQEFKQSWYLSDLELLKKMKATNDIAIKFFVDLEQHHCLPPEGNYLSDPEMQRIVHRWNDAFANPRFGTSYMNAMVDVVKHVEAPAKSCRARKIHYNFIQKEIKRQLDLNDALVKDLRNLKTTLEESRRRILKQLRP